MSDGAAVELASGLGFTEGPVWTRDGRLLVVSMSRGLIYEVEPGAPGVRAVAEPGGGPNGLAADAHGVLWIAQNGGRHRRSSSARRARPSIQRCAGEDVAEAAGGPFTAPNDCALGPDGRLWFTDPAGAAFAADDTPGRVWALDRLTGETDLMADELAFPNGLAFSGAELYVAETRRRSILRCRLTADGLSTSDEFVAFTDASPDGIAFDRDGHLHVAAPDADCLIVVRPDGVVSERIQLPSGSFPTNVCFGGSDGRTLFVTAAGGGRVLALARERPGLPVPDGDRVRA